MQLDLADCALEALPCLADCSVVLVAKHLCGAATDFALRAANRLGPRLDGLAVATCCHHRCTWKAYVNKPFLARWFTPQEFGVLARMAAWWSCGAPRDTHGGGDGPTGNAEEEEEAEESRDEVSAVETLTAADAEGDKAAAAVGRTDFQILPAREERIAVGGLCRWLLDEGRRRWLAGEPPAAHPGLPAPACAASGVLSAELVAFVAASVSPENHLLVAARLVGARSS